MDRCRLSLLLDPILEKCPDAAEEIQIVKDAMEGILQSKKKLIQTFKEATESHKDRWDWVMAERDRREKELTTVMDEHTQVMDEHTQYRVSMSESLHSMGNQLKLALWKLGKSGVAVLPPTDDINELGALYVLVCNKELAILRSLRKDPGIPPERVGESEEGRPAVTVSL